MAIAGGAVLTLLVVLAGNAPIVLKNSRSSIFKLDQTDTATDEALILLGIICAGSARKAARILPADFFNTVRPWWSFT
jgi:hypothetical protein